MGQNDQSDESEADDIAPDPEASAVAALRDKFLDIQGIGVEAEFDPDEAEQAGAFIEDALELLDAVQSRLDALDDDAGASDGKEPW